MIRFIFVLCCLVIFSISIFGQNLNADLANSFKKYSIVKINNQEALKKARNQEPFKFKADGKTFQFILTPNEIRSEKYKAEYTDKSGVHSLPKTELFTYTGTLIGERNSALALTVNGSLTEGLFLVGTEKYYLEPAKKYSSFAGDDEKIVYRTKDKVKKEDFVCGLDETIAGQLEETKASILSFTNSPQWNGIKILELATDADYQWVQQFGGDQQAANNYIISTLNAVDVIYRRDLKLTVRVIFQNAWAFPDPYPTNGTANTLNGFRNYWNANYSFVQRDAAHLFTGKYLNQGFAYIGVVCSNPSSSYGLSGYVAFGGVPAQELQILETAHEIGHNLGANHVGVNQGCSNTIMVTPLSPDVTANFCNFSINEITNFITNNINNGYDCLANEIPPDPPKTLFDFDADGKADISVFRPSDTFWYIQQSTAGFYAFQFGVATDKLAPADYDGDRKTDIAVFRDGNWYLQRSSLGFLAIAFGAAGDIPVPGDFDGDGKAELVVFRPSNGVWYTYNLINNQTGGMQFGQNGDKPLMGDFDGDNKNDYAVFRAGTWYIQRSTQGFYTVAFGYGTDIPAPADFDGDGQTDIAVFRPSDGVWSVQRSTAGFYGVQFGQSGDIPNPADYDGDGKADISLFRPIADPGQPTYGAWYRINSSSQSSFGIAFGQNGDIPIPSFNIVQ